jgi:putative FmdB family regulatory protein
MPTYEYVCEACGHALEIFHGMSEAPRRKCPACGKPRLVRKIGTGAGVIFKGSGFYLTDYRSDSYKQAEKAEGGASETKPAEKPAQAGEPQPAPEKKAPKKKPEKG